MATMIAAHGVAQAVRRESGDGFDDGKATLQRSSGVFFALTLKMLVGSQQIFLGFSLNFDPMPDKILR